MIVERPGDFFSVLFLLPFQSNAEDAHAVGVFQKLLVCTEGLEVVAAEYPLTDYYGGWCDGNEGARRLSGRLS